MNTRRRFIRNAAIGLGVGMTGLKTRAGEVAVTETETMNRRPWAGTVSTHEMQAASPEELAEQVLKEMEKMIPFHADIISLPETFAFNTIDNPQKAADAAKLTDGDLFDPLRNFARLNHCYIVCPSYVLRNGSVYNAALLFDRSGKTMGEYLKIHPAEDEIQAGIRPGPVDPPVFDTDFGRIGIQICYDLKWDDGWTMLKQKGAEIIFWPSAYAGGQELCSKAWRHQVFIISSTRKNTARICDITGKEMAKTGFWQPNHTVSAINLEKVCIPTWPYIMELDKVTAKYGNKITITTYDEEEWTFLESTDPQVRIMDVVRQFNLKTQYQALSDVGEMQKVKR
jgi:beta-ureidopropionase